MTVRRWLSVPFVAAALVAHSSPARSFTLGLATDPVHDAGQTLTVRDESVELVFVSASSAYDDEFRLTSPDGERSFSCAKAIAGLTVPGGHYDAETELLFSLAIPPGDAWMSGPGDRNPDQFAHARLTQVEADTVLLEWEDLPGGGDADFNDCVVLIVIK